MHFFREKVFLAFLRSTKTATAATPLATCCSNQSPGPSMGASTPPETPTLSYWGWAVSQTADAAVRTKAVVQTLVSRSSALTGRVSGSSPSANFSLLMGVRAPPTGLSHIHNGMLAAR